MIVHKTDASLLLCYVDHHDKAYQWAEKRRLETHPHTGAAQLVEIRETVREIEVPSYVSAAPQLAPQVAPPCLAGVVREDLLSYGVPAEWVDECLAADDNRLLSLVDRLPSEAAEALLVLATGGRPEPRTVAIDNADPFNHPDALRRFRILDKADELSAALDAPWEKWIVFLHPAQRGLVDRRFSGPSRVSGSAGTGKTIVAIHRAAAAVKANQGHVLLTTFSEDLAKALRQKVKLLVPADRVVSQLSALQDQAAIANDSRSLLLVTSVSELATQLANNDLGKVTIVQDAELLGIIESIAKEEPNVVFSPQFLRDEWNDVVDGWNLTSWEEYRNFKRLGRKSRLRETDRNTIWNLFKRLRQELTHRNARTMAMIYSALANSCARPFRAVIVDECQDVSPGQLRFLCRLAGENLGELFFAGDLGQRIFQAPFSWSTLGVDIRGRSRTLKINYRTSHQIRQRADRLLDNSLFDVDGNEEHRDGTVSVFNGPPPAIYIADDEEAESDHVADWILERINDQVDPSQIAIIGRTNAQLARARDAIRKASDISGRGLGAIRLATMHEAKGLEFRCVCVMACDDNIIPLEERIQEIGDQADLKEIYNTERHLLYVACTRARDHLLITGVDPVSEFLVDLSTN